MPLYYSGYSEAQDRVRHMTREQLFSLVDSLYGRNHLPYQPSDEELLQEALDQLRRDWTDTSSDEYAQLQFWAKLFKSKEM